MKQHQMTHKFRDHPGDTPVFLSSPCSNHLNSPPPLTPPRSDPACGSSPIMTASPPSPEPALSPPFGGGGVKRPQEDEANTGVSLVDRPPEKRAILCG